jgi:hypothetical protein
MNATELSELERETIANLEAIRRVKKMLSAKENTASVVDAGANLRGTSPSKPPPPPPTPTTNGSVATGEVSRAIYRAILEKDGDFSIREVEHLLKMEGHAFAWSSIRVCFHRMEKRGLIRTSFRGIGGKRSRYVCVNRTALAAAASTPAHR